MILQVIFLIYCWLCLDLNDMIKDFSTLLVDFELVKNNITNVKIFIKKTNLFGWLRGKIKGFTMSVCCVDEAVYRDCNV